MIQYIHIQNFRSVRDRPGSTEHFFHSAGQRHPRQLIAILMGVTKDAKEIPGRSEGMR
jgi:AAA15 family ATPase/GTPase